MRWKARLTLLLFALLALGPAPAGPSVDQFLGVAAGCLCVAVVLALPATLCLLYFIRQMNKIGKDMKLERKKKGRRPGDSL